MSDLMKGNFSPKKKVRAASNKKETLEEKFEKEAMKRIGGSITFVSKEKVRWDLEGKQPPPK